MHDDLVRRLRKCATEAGACKTCELDSNPSCTDVLMEQAADAIEELSAICEEQKAQIITMAAEEKPRWIPVTERLPEEVRKSYLCRTDSGYHCEVRWTDNVYGLWTGGGGQWGWSIFDIPQYAKVTHWMPLPSTEGLNET